MKATAGTLLIKDMVLNHYIFHKGACNMGDVTCILHEDTSVFYLSSSALHPEYPDPQCQMYSTD